MKKILMAMALCLMCAVSFTQDSNNSVYIYVPEESLQNIIKHQHVVG